MANVFQLVDALRIELVHKGGDTPVYLHLEEVPPNHVGACIVIEDMLIEIDEKTVNRALDV